MKIFSKNALLLTATLTTTMFSTGFVSANMQQPNIINVSSIISNNASSISASNATYTANGKMDKKTAVMLVNLLRNPHLQVRAEVNGQKLQTISPRPNIESRMKRAMDVLVNYTITGKTTRSNVLKLKRLIQNSKHIQISAHANINANPQRFVNAPRIQNHNRFMTGFTPFYSSVTPPTYVQGNTVWVPVAITNPSVALPNTATEMFARN